ncbi:glycoside hydrolase family 2 TIM barrel-domain containing protein [Pricia sp. S334]|uniref:Glycoside hydrolase family 2 TIM barrel-domain containing protein n=1 Tax=Pricia mediterranea TaxID=3076079 RepID=A0ABU3L6I5_9FLAO|nr:sugar-binding domain-containing protein [Pricia sp. S334]MDT7828819.1 glycoside hydrolase family 2 TIM barrel-domain containing protein [Pricia sp. S334]
MNGNPIKIQLSQHWRIRSSRDVSDAGSVISSPGRKIDHWIDAEVPSTVLGALVDAEIVKDPFVGDNLKNIATEQFEVSWWYATDFTLDTDQAESFAVLKFEGINYKAQVWLNGKQIAGPSEINGAYRRTSFEVSKNIVKGRNFLAVEVLPPKPGDFSTGYVDWNPAPPDGNMGIFRPVSLRLHHGVRIENPFVRTKVDLKTLKHADLTVTTEMKNDTSKEVSGILKGRIASKVFERHINLSARGETRVEFRPDEFPQLAFKNPRLWWPVHLGSPDLYELELEFIVDGRVSSAEKTTFGIREVEAYWLNDIHRGYKINGQKVMIKGAGWTDDLFLKDSDKSLEAQVRYVKQMNLNCIRLEGIWGKDHQLYDLCDKHGILLMVGWSCHWEHEIHMGIPVDERYGGVYRPEDIEHIAQAWQEQVIWLRNHPSIFVWTVASDKVPITVLEQKYIETFAEYDPDRPYLNSTGGVGSDQHVVGSEDVVSEISGSSGVKMLGPYAYTAPRYWFTDTKFGGAYGFNTETGPGAQPPQLKSLKKFIPRDKLWPINEIWDYHCGLYEFKKLDRFEKALNARYGKPNSIEEFDRKAQAMNYELMRPMFEAFQVNKKKCTGVVQWMLNAAWPKMYWQLYDYYLMPTGAFYATQKACSALHLAYNYGDRQVYLINDHKQDMEGLKARIRVYDIDSQLVLEEERTLDAPADSSVSVFKTAAKKGGLSTTYFLDLRLRDAQNKEMDTNFYWLSTREETLDYEAYLGEFAYHTPSKQYADLNLLNTLSKVNVEVVCNLEEDGDAVAISATLKNNGTVIAFLINLHVIEKETGEAILPIFWEDNFISLLPGEKRTLRATFTSTAVPELEVAGWNLNKTKTNNDATISDSRGETLP